MITNLANQRGVFGVRRMWTLALAMAAFVTASSAMADDATPILIRAKKIYLSPERVVSPGAILVRDGKIDRIDETIEIADEVRVVNLEAATITAGLIDANTNAGYRFGYHDAEHASECIPEMRVLDTIDLESNDFRRLAQAGVTTVYVSPDSASVIGAQGTIVRTAGPVEARVVQETAGVKATLGREPIFKASFNRTPSQFGTSFLTRRPTTRMGLVWVFRKSFHDAQTFARGETPGTRGEGSPSDAAIPNLIRILNNEIPFRIQARSQLDILTAIRLSHEFNLKFVLEEGTDAYRCIDELKADNIPVIYGPIFDYPIGFRAGTGESDRFRYSAPAELVNAGVTLALSAGDITGEGALPMQAGYAMRLGLTREQALAAATTIPAGLLNISDLAGSLDAGRAADLVVWSGEPFEATTRAEMVFINGRLVSDRTVKKGS